MKKTLALVFIISLSFLLSSCSNNKKADEIWITYLENLGSYDINRIEKTIADSSMSVYNGDTIINVARIIYPDKINFKIYRSNGEIKTIIVNGDKGVIITPDGRTELSKESIENYKNMGLIYPEFYYVGLGYSLKLVSTEIIDNQTYYNIEVTTKTGVLNYYISKDDYSLYKMTLLDMTVEILESMEVDDVFFIKKSKISDKQDTTYRYRYDVNLNINIDEKYFKL